MIFGNGVDLLWVRAHGQNEHISGAGIFDANVLDLHTPVEADDLFVGVDEGVGPPTGAVGIGRRRGTCSLAVYCVFWQLTSPKSLDLRCETKFVV